MKFLWSSHSPYDENIQDAHIQDEYGEGLAEVSWDKNRKIYILSVTFSGNIRGHLEELEDAKNIREATDLADQFLEDNDFEPGRY